jgi:hypothetical protein
MPNVARSACEPNFYALDIQVIGADEPVIDRFWTDFGPKSGNRCSLEKSGTQHGFKGQIYCMYKLRNGNPPKTVLAAAVINTLAGLTPKTGGEDGPIEIVSVKSRLTCKPTGGGGCIRVNCPSGTMDVPNCRPCG